MTVTRQTEQVDLHITPLSPVHVGCGIDFDPTGYVIADGLLYHFDPAGVPLDPADRTALLTAANRPGEDALMSVQRFFGERAQACMGTARIVVPVATGVQQQYERRLGQVAQREATGRQVTNRLDIERTAHHPHTGVAYLPGSGLKGSLRTAWLDRLNDGRSRERDERAGAMEKRLLEGGAFHTDPFRLLAVGDAAGPDVVSQVVFATNHKKREVFRDGIEQPGKGPSARRECIAPGQLAALRCTLSVEPMADHSGDRTPLPRTRIGGWQAVAEAANRFYLPRLRKELDLLDARRFCHPDWLAGMRRLMAELQPDLDAGRAALLRVGRHGGAESVTLDGAREGAIRIMKGPGQPAAWGDEATTVWLAADQESARSEMQPFGWVLLHRADADLPALRAWCEHQPRRDLAQARLKLATARQVAAAAAAARSERDAARLAADAARAEAVTREEARLAGLSDQGRQVEALRAQLLAHTAARKQPLGGVLYGAVRGLLTAVEKGDWAAADRAALADLLGTLVPEKIDLGGKAKDIRQAARRLASESP